MGQTERSSLISIKRIISQKDIQNKQEKGFRRDVVYGETQA